MNEKEKKDYLNQYNKEKEKGILFFPDTLFKDAVVVLGIFLILIALVISFGAPLEERADPADTSYTPRPEWYFLFLFQLLKYFPGQLEFLGVVVIPTIAIILLFLLPFLDRNAKRHYSNRKIITIAVLLSAIGITTLTALSITETPPPSDVQEGGDQTAALYTENCATCHGPSISITQSTNLHQIIAEGKHEGMPAWSGDLTTDQIDALAGFILSPGGSNLFTINCGECHDVNELVASDPLELKKSLDAGIEYGPHNNLDIPTWTETLSRPERTSLINFLIAPDGKRLFTTNCSQCHGQSIAYSGTEDELRETIATGGLHLLMPAWQDKLNMQQIDVLANYVMDPTPNTEGEGLFENSCASCHGKRIPNSDSLEQAKDAITSGGAHETMPIWGEILTDAQLVALVTYSLETTTGVPSILGQDLYATYCSSCHGDFGEGGTNPARPDDVIAPISTAEYLKTRDDFTLASIIAQGQPNFGMSPFGSSYGGPLSDDQIDSIVAFMRSWESDPPVEFPPEIKIEATVDLSAEEIYLQLCAQCHGKDGLGVTGPSLRDPQFRSSNDAQDIFETIGNGHEATPMISWGNLLDQEQIQGLTEYIMQFEPTELDTSPQPTPGFVSFENDIMPVFEAKCIPCHGNMGGWDGTSYEAVMKSGDNAPTVIPEDVDNSILAQKILGTQNIGGIMPPGGKMTSTEIELILDWIREGAKDN